MAAGSSTLPNNTETVTLKLPTGEAIDAIVPHGLSDDDVKSYVQMKRPDLFGAPAGIKPPQVNMQPNLLGSAASSITPESVIQGKVAAARAYGANASEVATRYSADPNDPMPHAGGRPNVAVDASNAALAGSTVAAPFTGGYGLLTRLGLVGAGAGAGSAISQLSNTGKIDPNQTAGDITSYGTVPELGSTGAGLAINNAARLKSALIAGGKQYAEKSVLGSTGRAMLNDLRATAPAQPNPADVLATLKNSAGTASESAPVQLGKLIKNAGGPDLSKLPAMTPGQSTTIASHGYEPASQRMVVQFKNGNVYEYKGVPQEVYDGFANSESQGSYHAQNLKGRYTTNRIGTVKPSK